MPHQYETNTTLQYKINYYCKYKNIMLNYGFQNDHLLPLKTAKRFAPSFLT